MSTGITDILQRLRAARRHDDAMHALKGMFLSLAIILGAVLFLLGLEAALWLGMTWRTVLCGGLVTGAVALVAWLTGVPAARRWGILPGESDLHTAGRVGHVYPEVHDRLLNAKELGDAIGRVAAGAGGFRPSLVAGPGPLLAQQCGCGRIS